MPVFAELADDSANHHERLDGSGYFRGLSAEALTQTARVPAIIGTDRGTAFCPDSVDALPGVIEAMATARPEGPLHHP